MDNEQCDYVKNKKNMNNLLIFVGLQKPDYSKLAQKLNAPLFKKKKKIVRLACLVVIMDGSCCGFSILSTSQVPKKNLILNKQWQQQRNSLLPCFLLKTSVLFFFSFF